VSGSGLALSLGPRFRGDERSRGRLASERRLAMIVVVMVTVPMAMIMAVIMAIMMIMTLRMVVGTAVLMLAVGAVLRIERRLHWRKPRAEPAQHVLDHMIAPDAQPVAGDLHVDMPVADMPGEPRQLMAVGGGDFDQRLRPANDAHDSTVIEHEAVAIAQSRRLRQIEQKLRSALAGQNNAAPMPLVRIERHPIDGAGVVPVARGFDFARTLHRSNPKLVLSATALPETHSLA